MNRETEEFQVFLKPAGSRCNLNCAYCYYLGKGSCPDAPAATMSPVIIEKYIRHHFESSPGPEVFFSWHGGEPLLAGIDFYARALEIQDRFKPASYIIYNGIQTNATLVNEDWCRFLAENRFYVGVSIDGPEKMNDINRRFSSGAGAFKKSVAGFRLLHQHGVMNEVLCVVSKANVSEPLEVYSFFKSLGARFITFLPLVIHDSSTPEMVTGQSVPSAGFGHFLSQVFDEWVREDIGRIKIQIFEESVKTAFGQEPSLCVLKKICGRVPVMDMNGDLYSCDHYVDRRHLVGNIKNTSLAELLNSDFQKKFGLDKLNTLPLYCLECDVREFCNGECPRNRFIKTPAGEPRLNYLCQGYKIFFNHISPFVKSVRAEWMRREDRALS